MARYRIDNVDYPIDFQETDIVKRALQNAKNLLMCRMGEVPYDRRRGFDPALFDLPLPMLKAELMPELDIIMAEEPDVKVVEADAYLLPNGETYIRVILNCTIDDNEE